MENTARVFELRKQVCQMRQNKAPILTYYIKLQTVWDEIQAISPTPKCDCKGCSCDLSKKISNARDKERLYDFLMGLDDEYSTIKTQILSTNPTPSLNTAYYLVVREELQRHGNEFVLEKKQLEPFTKILLTSWSENRLQEACDKVVSCAKSRSLGFVGPLFVPTRVLNLNKARLAPNPEGIAIRNLHKRFIKIYSTREVVKEIISLIQHIDIKFITS